jgi:phage N-6-adenine-methyltransferase
VGVDRVLFSSKSDNWATPQWLFDDLNREFRFTVDVCATEENAKCERYFPPEMNGLLQEWTGVCWCNPPYGRQIKKWIEKASKSNATVVCLVPARTDTKWFHDYCYHKAEIRFIRGRLRFGNSTENAPFPSMVLIFRNKCDEM